MRSDLESCPNAISTAASYTELDEALTRELLRELLVDGVGGRASSGEHNPVVRHVVLRRRKTLEEAGLMKPVAVQIHPRENEPVHRTPGILRTKRESGRHLLGRCARHSKKRKSSPRR